MRRWVFDNRRVDDLGLLLESKKASWQFTKDFAKKPSMKENYPIRRWVIIACCVSTEGKRLKHLGILLQLPSPGPSQPQPRLVYSFVCN